MPSTRNKPGRGILLSSVMALLLLAFAPSVQSQTFTNLAQLTQVLNFQPRTNRNIRLEVTVCAASRPEIGVVAVQDDSGVELLELGDFERELRPGEKILIQGYYCLLRQREMGIELSAGAAVDNDGFHVPRTWGGSAILKAGYNPIRLDWFNALRGFHLEVLYSVSNAPYQSMEASNMWHAVVDDAGRTNYLPGLRAENYAGYWEVSPNFNLLQPSKVGIVTGFDLGFRTDDEMVGIRYSGFYKAAYEGLYQLRTRSDDGSLLFLGKPEIPIISAGFTNVPLAQPGFHNDAMDSLLERRWVTIGGRVGFISKKGRGLEFELRSDQDVILVKVADAAELDVLRLQNAQVQVTGVGRGVLTVNGRVVLEKLMVTSSHEVELVENAYSHQPSRGIVPIHIVQSLPLEAAHRALPVRVRGVVTEARNSGLDHRMSIQDDTRGIFVNLNAITDTHVTFREFVEVEGHSGAGDFAPIIVADKVTILGAGRLPEPTRPTWTELLNGSKDVQWAELQGLVTEVQNNRVSLLLPEGQLEVLMDGHPETQLKPFEKSLIRIRGVLYAMWNAETREVSVGSVKMRNATICVDAPAPSDPFDAVLKTPRQLRLFDAQATAFRRVKVRGQVVYADATQVFLEDDKAGLRLLLSGTTDLRPGDLVEAVGYPDIGRTALLLREVILRKTGVAALPPASTTKVSELNQTSLDSTRVSIQGKLLGWHLEQGAPVLEMQSGQHLYLARLLPGTSGQVPLRVGSQLALHGVYVGRGANQHSHTGAESFELLLNSQADIVLLSQPSWWTLPRLLIFMGILVVILAVAAIWITQLRRLVEQRTTQLRGEIQERERIERQHAVEAERSRIARDLHDDLGASLTEISVLASTGQRPKQDETSHNNLFHTIAGKARSLVASLDVIVWAVDPEDNSLQSLADYMTGHTEDFFAHMNLSCRFKVPVAFPHMNLDGRVRHDLLMAVKEALNNIVRHAEATEVEFRMAVDEKRLTIDIADNGKGFEGGSAGHGLKNLPARLLKLGGTCEVESRLGGGTTVKIRLPFSAFSGVKAPAGKS
jgi:signal transduction histidine kinase